MSAKLYSLRRSTELNSLFDYAAPRHCPKQKRAKRDKKEWQPEIIDDWAERIIISEQELDLFEVHCSDLLNEIFGAGS